MIRFVAQLLAVLALTTAGHAADHYVCQGATGTGDGSSWANAFTDFNTGTGQANPSSLIRGDTYWVAAGNYTSGGVNFSTPNSGTSVITIQAATDSAHGSNSTGWTDGGTGACHQGQALFTALVNFTTDYWIFNGAYRSTSTGSPWLDWRTGYGFAVNNSAGGGNPINATAAILVGGPNLWTNTVNDVTIKYVEVVGSFSGTGTSNEDRGIRINPASGGTSQNDVVEYNYINNTANAALSVDGNNHLTVEYNWLQNDVETPAHSELIAIECSGSPGVNSNETFAFNYLENSQGTAMMSSVCGSQLYPSNFYIYGNLFFGNQAEGDGTIGYGNGDGAINLFTWNTFSGLYIYNNTFSLVSQQTGSGSAGACGITLESQGTSPTMTNVYIENNLFYGCNNTTASNKGVNPQLCPSGTTCTNYNWAYNAYFNTPTTDSASSPYYAQIASTDPFTNVSQTVNADNFSLAFDTSPWTALSAPYNTDLLGNTRTSSRGAFQFTGSSGVPNPPTELTATVN